MNTHETASRARRIARRFARDAKRASLRREPRPQAPSLRPDATMVAYMLGRRP